jgi:hypothetical protein
LAILLTTKNKSKTYDLDKFQDIQTLHCGSIPISKYYFDSTFFSRVFRVFERKIVFFRKSQKRNLTYFRFHWLFLSLFFSGTNHPKHSLTHTHTHTHPHTHIDIHLHTQKPHTLTHFNLEKHTQTHTHTHTCTHTHAHTYTHTHTHKHTLTYTYTHRNHTHSHILTYKNTHTHTETI